VINIDEHTICHTIKLRMRNGGSIRVRVKNSWTSATALRKLIRATLKTTKLHQLETITNFFQQKLI